MRLKITGLPCKGLVTASQLLAERPPAIQREWRLESLLGRFVEISGGATTSALTCTASLILQAQLLGESAAWVAGGTSIFFPPDFADSGIDLDALPVVRAGNPHKAARAAGHLLRAGSFALVVLDVEDNSRLSQADQTSLSGLAHHANTALVCLTRRTGSASPTGSLVSLRLEADRARLGFDRFRCEYLVVKDKRQGPGWRHQEVCRGTDGLC